MALAWCCMCSCISSLSEIIQTLAAFYYSSASSSSRRNSYSLTSSSLFNYDPNRPSANMNYRTDSDNDKHDYYYRQPSTTVTNLIALLISKFLICFSMNVVCLYAKYLIDSSQRNAFIETRRSIETRAKIERENNKQERLLLSLLPSFVAFEIIADIAKEENHDNLLSNQFHKIYIHDYSDVR